MLRYDFKSKIAYMPGTRQILEEVKHCLSSGSSVLVVLPETTETSLVLDQLHRSLTEQGGSHPSSVFLPQLAGPGFAGSLSRAFNLRWPNPAQPHTLPNLLSLPDLPPLILLEEFELLSLEQRQDWLGFMQEWSRLCQPRLEQGLGSASLCLVTRGSYLPNISINSQERFQVIWWWGFISALEINLAANS